MINNPSIETSRKFYALLLNLYPGEHRSGYAASMLQVFTDQCRAAYRQKGGLGLLFLWLRTLPDLGYSAIVEHISSPRASWGLMEPVPNAPLPWKGVLLILLPGLVYLVSQVAQLTGQPWYMTVYYRAAFFLILPPVFVWIFTRRFPLWGLIPIGLLFRLVQEIGYQLITLHPGAFSSNPALQIILNVARTMETNPYIMGGIFTAVILLLGWLFLRKRRPGRSFWLWAGAFLLVALAQCLLDLRWILPYTREMYPAIDQGMAWEMFRSTIGWDLYNFSAILLLVFLGTLFTRRHGMFSILILVGYIMPALVIGTPWNLEENTSQIVFITTAVLAYRGLLSLVTPIWMSRTPSQTGKKRVVLVLAGLALIIHAGMQFYPGIFRPSGAEIPNEWLLSVALAEAKWFTALLLGLALYQDPPAPAETADEKVFETAPV